MMFKLPNTATTSLSVWPRIRCGKQGEMDERRRPAAGAIGHAGCRRRRGKSPTRRWALRWPQYTSSHGHLEAAIAHHQLEVRDQPFDRRVDLPLVGQRPSARRCPTFTGPAGRFSIAWATIFRLSSHLGHAHQVAGKAVARRRRSRPGNRNRRRPGTARPCAGRGSRRWPGRPGPVQLRLMASSLVSTPTPLVRSTKMRLRFSSRSMSSSVLRESAVRNSRIISTTSGVMSYISPPTRV